MLFQKMMHFFSDLLFYERSSDKIAFAFSLAIYIALSPFFGVHTLMAICAGLVFKLNIPLLLLIGNTINNPFTMVPLYSGGYLFGYWLVHTVCGVSMVEFNPAWMGFINNFLHNTLGIEHVSFWAFIVGGNVLGVIFGLISYPLVKYIFTKIISTRKKKDEL